MLCHFAPKHLYSGLEAIKLSNYFAASIFNDGYSCILKIFNAIGIIIGPAASNYAADKRYYEATCRRPWLTGCYERPPSSSKKGFQQSFEEEEGALYGPGITD